MDDDARAEMTTIMQRLPDEMRGRSGALGIGLFETSRYGMKIR